MSASTSKQITVIRPGSGGLLDGLRELWQFRDLMFFLVLRGVSVRYKQTVIGFAWAFIQPLFSTIVFSVIFGYFAKLPPPVQ